MSALGEAVKLILSGDSELFSICLRSLRFSASSIALASVIGIPLGFLLKLKSFPGRKLILVIVNSLMALPTVVVGLLIYSLISRSGPFGSMGMLFTPAAIILGQVILVLPIVTSMVYGSVSNMDPRLPETLQTLGANGIHYTSMMVSEMKGPILSAVLAGFGRAIGEVGVSMMLGGNIRWYTRTITTTISLQTSKGEFELGLALGIILMIIAFTLNFLIHLAVRNE
ncbi:ABC transporter permease subunit [Oceanispirochaeta crateris]|jgi:tungstate transport system permease protein|uniref:ABC transporter permease subunit n=1 Tax=Oceanispirochaeta crateris TaxID=2518645 RepID=A0A5C1QGU1_9SPIO|nr:ABC transporter permease [Oceanispirochaeta crateris]QEN06528.1 ABC transporter permease subunit [Oceanispirochaeta crateris]